MDEIYGDLENYNDVNAIDELRNENEDLKSKVQRYEAEIAKLHQDLDKLQSEHKILEINYSSLLKTARAEVERKALIIKNLNQEKDAMVLNSLKNSDKSLLNIRRNLVRCGYVKDTQIPKELDTKNNESDRKKDTNCRPPQDIVTTCSSMEKPDKVPVERNLCDKNSESKENKPYTASLAQSIRNRRKSMPVFNKQPRFSSDDEFDENDSADESHKIDRPGEEKHRRTYTKHKVSETSGIDDKYSSHHESSRETYYRNRYKIVDCDQRLDKFRTYRDKYESSRYRRSPEYRRLKGYPEDSYKRIDGRRRVLESPPRSHDFRRARERRSDFDRHYGDRSRSRHERAPKHKLLSAEEPTSKRTRNDSSNRQAVQNIELERPKTKEHNEERIESAPNKNIQNVEERVAMEKCPPNKNIQNVEERVAMEKCPKTSHAVEDRVTNLLSKNLHEDSCQSPDHVFGEVVHVPREIKLTPTSKLEDPRLKSSKYIKTDCDNISTTVGKNTDLKRVNISSWDVPRVPMPEALQRPPQDSVKQVKELHQTPMYTDKLRKHVYMEIENPVSNLSISMESGEILSDSETPAVNLGIGDFINDFENKRNRHVSHFGEHEVIEKKIGFGGQNQNVSSEKNGESNLNIAKTGLQNVEHTSSQKSFRIPKLTKTENSASTSTEEAIRDVLRESSKVSSIEDYKSMEKSKEPTDGDGSLSSSKESLDTSKPKIILKLSELKGYRKLSPREIVAEDLELSDNNSDFIRMTKRKSKNKTKKHSLDQKTEINEIACSLKPEVTKNYSKLFNDPDLNYKKQKPKMTGKSKSSKTKELCDKKVEETIDTSAKLNKKTEKTRDKNAKFNELFGDSISSLITPEDLGVRLKSDSQPVDSYVPIFEDAQDADDIIVNKITQVQTLPTESKTVAQEARPDNSRDVHEREGLKTVNDKIDKLGHVKTIYENLFPGDDDTKDTEVVKTVVLATGLQPQHVHESANVFDLIDDSNTQNLASQGLPRLQGTPLHALATSTPYKPFNAFDMYKTPQKPVLVNDVIEEARAMVSSCNSRETTVEKTDVSSVSRTSTEQSSVPKAEGDVPDVRIFVKRRKRVGKKSL